MDKIILSHKSALIFYREYRINKRDVKIVHYVTELMLSKKKSGKQSVDVMVKSKRLTHNN